MVEKKIVITGAAGLVGQNIIPNLTSDPGNKIVAIDMHSTNLSILRGLHPQIRVVEADLAKSGHWQTELEGCTHLVIGHAQIGGIVSENYIRNNITASERLVESALGQKVPYIVSISSSVVNSMVIDDYTETKKRQERLIAASGIKQVVLRPTLMFGWFDRKHVGWLARFMHKVPIFPIPGDGKYLRQPLYVGDLSAIIASALETEITGIYNISGQEKIDYIDLMRLVRDASGAKTHIQKVPYSLFRMLLQAGALVDKNPAFTVKQLTALVTPDVFEVIDWPRLFNVSATPLKKALEITFQHPVYSKVVLQF